MPLIRRARAFALALTLAGSTGCGLVHHGPSEVAQGRYFSTGNPDYDEFFLRLHRMQVELETAPETLATARRDVVKSVALEPAASDEALRKALKTKAGEVSARGATLVVERGREAKAGARLAVLGTPASVDRERVKTLGDSLARVSAVRDRLDAWQRELEWLPPNAVALDRNVEAAFVGQSRATRAAVRQNLADAQKVVALMGPRLKEIDATSSAIEQLFVSAVGENRHEPPPPPPSEPSAPAAKPRPRAAARAEESRPAASDETPAASPKPKPGSARPDFEP